VITGYVSLLSESSEEPFFRPVVEDYVDSAEITVDALLSRGVVQNALEDRFKQFEDVIVVPGCVSFAWFDLPEPTAQALVGVAPRSSVGIRRSDLREYAFGHEFGRYGWRKECLRRTKVLSQCGYCRESTPPEESRQVVPVNDAKTPQNMGKALKPEAVLMVGYIPWQFSTLPTGSRGQSTSTSAISCFDGPGASEAAPACASECRSLTRSRGFDVSL